MDAHWIATIGLLLDIVGALWIAKGIITGTDDELARASDQHAVWGGPTDAPAPRPAMLKMLEESRRDTRIGVVLLVLGFIGQLVAQWM
jgi:hypothetical protein